jgi:hypothetical protein
MPDARSLVHLFGNPSRKSCRSQQCRNAQVGAAHTQPQPGAPAIDPAARGVKKTFHVAPSARRIIHLFMSGGLLPGLPSRRIV